MPTATITSEDRAATGVPAAGPAAAPLPGPA